MINPEGQKELLNTIPIKNIQISVMGCYIVVFEKTPQEVINIFKKRGYSVYKNGVYHKITDNKNFFLDLANRRNIYFSQHISKDILEDMNLLNLVVV